MVKGKESADLGENELKVFEVVKRYKQCLIKHLKAETKLPTDYLNKVLKQLSTRKLVKSIKTPEHKKLNVWVLYDYTEDKIPQKVCPKSKEPEED
jgi:DNA-binding MarR family transcriptional regulator